jgi:hypothetical protein
LERAGLITIGVDYDGTEWWTLTPAGVQVATQMTFSSQDDAEALLAVLLDAAEKR